MTNYTSKEVIDFLSKKWKDRNCQMCNEGTWQVQDKTFQLMEYHQGNIVIGGPIIPVIPVIPVTCTNCGNTVLVNAIIAGVIKPETEAQEKKE
jgi:RNase P subunit RPR2